MDIKSYDVSRLYTTYSGPYCGNSCPRCSCPSGKSVGDSWYQEYQDYFDTVYGQTTCAVCTCVSDGNGNNYVSCGSSSSYDIGSESCPPIKDEVYQCHYGSGSTGIINIALPN